MFDEEELQATIHLIEATKSLCYKIDIRDPAYYRYEDQGICIRFWNKCTEDSIEITVKVINGHLSYMLEHERGTGHPFDDLIYSEDVHYKYILEHLKHYKP